MTKQIEIPIQTKRLPEPPWHAGTQCYQLYAELAFQYNPGNPVASWVSLIKLAEILPGGVTRRISEIRKFLRPQGWDVVNRTDRSDGRTFSLYRLCQVEKNPCCGNCAEVDQSEPAEFVEYGTCAETGVQVYLANPPCDDWRLR